MFEVGDFSKDWCGMCSTPRIQVKMVDQEFQLRVKPYGQVNGFVTLTARVPLLICQVCGFSYTDYRTEEIQDKVVEQYWRNQK
jgi:hypothetical protein